MKTEKKSTRAGRFDEKEKKEEAGVRARKLVPSETCEKKEEGKMNDGKKEREEKKLN